MLYIGAYKIYMKSDLHETFRISSWGSPKMIQHILQVSSQEPSGSPKYDFEDGGSSGTSNHARKLKFDTQVKNNISWRSMMSRMTQSFKSPVRTHQCPPSMTLRMGGSWGTSNHAGEYKFGTQVNTHISWRSMMSKMTPSSKSPVRNLQCPPSMTLRKGGGGVEAQFIVIIWTIIFQIYNLQSIIKGLL